MARVAVYNLDGALAYQNEIPVTAPPDVATDLGPVNFPASVSSVHFLKLELRDALGKLLSGNFYWRALPEHQDDLTDLAKLPPVTLEAKAERTEKDRKRFLTVTLQNPGTNLAL